MLIDQLLNSIEYKYHTNFILKDENKSNLFITFKRFSLKDKEISDNFTIFENSDNTQFLNNCITVEKKKARHVTFYINLFGDYFNEDVNYNYFNLNVFIEKYDFKTGKYDLILQKINLNHHL